MSGRSRTWTTLVAGGALVAVLAGCTGDRASGAPADGAPSDDGTVVLVGTDDLRWDPPALELPSGPVPLELRCGPAANHNVVIIETGEEIAACPPGGIDVGTVDLAPGAYTLVCTVPGHSATMRGALTVSDG